MPKKLPIALKGLSDPTLRIANRKPTHARMVLTLVRDELEKDPSPVRNVEGLFIIEVLNKGVFIERWFLLFQGTFDKPYIGETRPVIPAYFKRNNESKRIKKSYPLTAIEVEDDDLLKLVTGGVSGFNAFSKGRVRIAGDLLLAEELEQIFRRSQGHEKALNYIRKIDHDQLVGHEEDIKRAENNTNEISADKASSVNEAGNVSLFETKAKL